MSGLRGQPQQAKGFEHLSLDRAFAKKTERGNFCSSVREQKCVFPCLKSL